MKIWVFAGLQSLIAAMGLAAYFLADNVFLATSAVVLAALLGISQPLLAAHKGSKLKVYQEQQWHKSIGAVDDQLQQLLDQVIEPPFPHRATVAVEIRNRFGDRAPGLISAYDNVVASIEQGSNQSSALAAQFAGEVGDWSVGPYLQGLAAMTLGDLEGAERRFCVARMSQSGWASPWLGWATAAFQQRRWDEIRQEHPNINGVEFQPFDAGDQNTFLELSEADREELTTLFQQTQESLGNYYAIAEFCHAKLNIQDSFQEFQKVA